MPTPPFWAGLRVRLDHKNTDGFLAGCRIYVSYAGSAPSGANCVTLATDIGGYWVSHLMPLMSADFQFIECDVLDLAAATGASGTAPFATNGGQSGSTCPAQVAANIEYNIARRYRGGKPRIYIPGVMASYQSDDAHLTSTAISNYNSAMTAFGAAIAALSVGSVGTLAHVNASYFQGYDKLQPPGGTWRGPGFKYPPAYRSSVHVDPITSYACKALLSSQRRRRTATNP